MNVISWARVSSTEQTEGYSIDAQLRAIKDKAAREGWRIVREFAVAESARRGAERVVFGDMMAWVKKHARAESIGAILSHKLDRICRNIRDAVRLQDLQDECGVRPVFVENQFGDGPEGELSFNMMAVVSQYFVSNLRRETQKGMQERVRQGWSVVHAPYGYVNVPDDPEQPVQQRPADAETVARIFELYATGDMTFGRLADMLEAEGRIFRPSGPRFGRSALSYILSNRFYIGEIKFQGNTYPGKHAPLVDRRTFETCQDVLSGKNRRLRKAHLPLSGCLLRCASCGSAITGGRIKRKLVAGGIREHVYYWCANSKPGADHPLVTWRACDLEDAIAQDLETLRMPSQEIADWFRAALTAALHDVTAHKRSQRDALRKRQIELRKMQERLLNAYIAGAVDEATLRGKSAEVKGQQDRVETALRGDGGTDDLDGAMALRLFDWTQKLAEVWRGSNEATRRDILEAVSLNRTVSDTSLCLEKRKPFDLLAEGPVVQYGTPCRI